MKRLFAPWRMEFIRAACKEEAGCFFCRYLEEPQADEKNLVLYRGQKSIVLLNRFPYNPGHLLIAPMRHIGDFGQLEDDELLEMMKLARQALKGMRKVAEPHGFNLGFNLERAAGAGVADHLHLHLLPRWAGDTNFMPTLAQTKVVPQSLVETYQGLQGLFTGEA